MHVHYYKFREGDRTSFHHEGEPLKSMPQEAGQGDLDHQDLVHGLEEAEEQAASGGVGEPITIKSVSLGAAWNILAQLVPQLLTLIQSLVVGRLLGPHDQGIQSFMIFVAVTGSAIFSVGLPLSLQRNVSEALGEGRASRASYLLRYGIRLSYVPGLMAAAINLLVGLTIYQNHYLAWITSAVYAAASAVHSVSSQGLLGLRQYRQASVTGVVAQVVSVPVIVLFLLHGYGIQTILTITMLAAVISAATTVWLVHRARLRFGLTGTPEEAERRATRRTLISFAWGAGILVLLETVVAQRSELAFLAAYHGDQPSNIAYYSVAFSAQQTAYKVPSSLLPVVLPTVTAMIAAGRMAQVRAGYLRGQRMLLVVSGIGVGFLLSAGAPVITALWGPDYRPAGDVLLIMAAVPVLLGALTAVSSSTLLGFDRLGLVVRAQVVAALVTLVLDATLILPWGMYGAAVANSLGALVSAVLLARAAIKEGGLRHPGAADYARVVGLLVVMAAPGLAAHFAGIGSWLALLLGLVGSALLLLVAWPLIKPMHYADLAVLGGMTDRLPGPARRWLDAGTRNEEDQAGEEVPAPAP